MLASTRPCCLAPPQALLSQPAVLWVIPSPSLTTSSYSLVIKSDMFTGTVLSFWASPGDHLMQEQPEGVPWDMWEFNISKCALTIEESGTV